MSASKSSAPRLRRQSFAKLFETLEGRRLLTATYKITELDAPVEGGSSLVAGAINNKGQVLLGSELGNFLYSAGTYTQLPTPNGQPLTINDLNDSGEIVGGFTNPQGQSEAYSLLNGKLTPLGFLAGATQSTAYAVNSKGDAVGNAKAADGHFHAVLFSGGKVSDLGVLPGSTFDFSAATGINDSGQIIGISDVGAANDEHAFLYSGGKIKDLGVLPDGETSEVQRGINNAGFIAGDATSSALVAPHVVTSTGGGTFKDFGTIGSTDFISVNDVNTGGAFVGNYDAPNGQANVQHGFIGQAGKLVDLNTLVAPASGYVIAAATGINDSGQISGYATIADGEIRAVLLTPAAVTPTDTDSISGTVFNDANDSHLPDTGETGVGGVVLTLTPVAGGVSKTFTTSATGVYSFTGLADGQYKVTAATPAGFTQTAPTEQPFFLITLSADQPKSTSANFGFFQTAATTSSVSGTVYVDTNGDGKQDNGESGLKGVTVALTLEAIASGVSVPAAAGATTVTTDASGKYTFSGLTLAGKYGVSDTVPAGYVQTAPASGKYDVLVGLSGPQAVTGEDFGIKLKTVTPTGATVNGTVYDDANADGSDDNGETGLKGVTVTLTLAAVTNGLNGPAATTTTTTDANGAYSFSNVAFNNRYDITVTPPSGYTRINPTGKITILVADSTVYANEDFGLNKPVVVPTTGSISGTVFNDANDDGKKAATGEAGLAGVTITLTPAAVAGKVQAAAVTTKVTDASGNYGFTGLAAGTYTVTATPPDGYTQTLPTSGGYTVTLTAGQAVTGELFGEFKKVVVPPKTASVAGTVFNDANDNGKKDAGEGGLAGVTVTLTPAQVVGNNVAAATVTAITDASGNYTFSGLAAGSYSVGETVLSGYTQTLPTTGGFTVTLAAQQAVTGEVFGQFKPVVVPPTGGTITGLLFNDDNGNGRIDASDGPTAPRTVFLDTNGNGKLDAGEKSVTSTADGHYTFTDVTPGNYKVSRLFPTGFHLSNPSAGTGGLDVLVTVASGKTAAANLGTYRYIRTAAADALVNAFATDDDLLERAGLA